MIQTLLSLALLHSASGYYFYINDGKKMCFSQDVAYDHEVFHVNSHVPELKGVDTANLRGAGVFAEVRDPDGAIVTRKTLNKEYTHFSFVSAAAIGTYTICIFSSGAASISDDGQIIVYIDISDHASKNAADIYSSSVESLPNVMHAVQQINSLVERARKETEAVKERDTRYRALTERSAIEPIFGFHSFWQWCWPHGMHSLTTVRARAFGFLASCRFSCSLFSLC